MLHAAMVLEVVLAEQPHGRATDKVVGTLHESTEDELIDEVHTIHGHGMIVEEGVGVG